MMIRLARAGTREIMLTDTVKFARAAGLSEATILRRHVLKLISIPIVTVFGLEFGSTLAFAVVTETIFSWPGVGKLIIDSINALDRPVMVAYLDPDRLPVRDHQPRGRPRLRAARSAPAPGAGGMNAETPAGAFWSEFRESRIAVAALAVVVAIVLAALLAPWITPQDPYDIGNLNLSDARRPPGFVGSGGLHASARHRRAGARPLLGDPLRPAHLAADGAHRRRRRARRSARTLGIVAAYAGGGSRR